MLTEAELAEIEARASAATQGPWAVVDYVDDYHDGQPEPGRFVGMQPAQGHTWYAADSTLLTASDAAFIAHAREDVPRLVAEVRRLRAIVRGVGVDPEPLTPADYPVLGTEKPSAASR